MSENVTHEQLRAIVEKVGKSCPDAAKAIREAVPGAFEEGDDDKPLLLRAEGEPDGGVFIRPHDSRETAACLRSEDKGVTYTCLYLKEEFSWRRGTHKGADVFRCYKRKPGEKDVVWEGMIGMDLQPVDSGDRLWATIIADEVDAKPGDKIRIEKVS